jgi:signal recognition particle subunit SRP54
MFETLSDKLQAVFGRLNSHGTITDNDLDEAMREVRLALLEADVNFRVVRDFIGRVRERAAGAEILKSLTPTQHIIGIVNEELIALLGKEQAPLNRSSQQPTIVMLVGLQGSGKTTLAAKLALLLRSRGDRPLLVAADVYRPAAVDQLEALGRQLSIPVFSQGTDVKPEAICSAALTEAHRMGATVMIVDTAGRLHIDEQMMEEVARLRAQLQPAEVLFVADAMSGQDAVNVAEEFHNAVGITGLVLTKMDGDARGGAALSIRAITGVPVKYIGTGEKPDALEPFYPDRLASRILGMGDVVTLVERAQAAMGEENVREIERKMRTAQFDLEDFLTQMQRVKKMGPMSQLLGMVPGLGQIKKQLAVDDLDDSFFNKTEAIIYSMTPAERHNPKLINGSRRRRISRGSGTEPRDVNQLLNQFEEARKIMKIMANSKGRGLSSLFR